MEIGEDGRLPFRDVLVHRRQRSDNNGVQETNTQTTTSTMDTTTVPGSEQASSNAQSQEYVPTHPHKVRAQTPPESPLHVVKGCLKRMTNNTANADSTDAKPKVLYLPYVQDLSESTMRGPLN